MIAHILLVENWEWLQMRLPAKSGNHKHVAQTTLYLQIPQHILESICVVLLFYGVTKVKHKSTKYYYLCVFFLFYLQSQKQLMLPWLIINVIGIALYSTILLVLGMILTSYLFICFFLVTFHCFVWYYIQCYYADLAQTGNIIYNVLE